MGTTDGDAAVRSGRARPPLSRPARRLRRTGARRHGGGAIDPGEDDAAALIREFGEETGLEVAPGVRLGHADQYFINDGEGCDNRQSLFEAKWVGEAPELKIEADHTLIWLAPLEAISRLRHDSHAWAVSLAVRRGAIAA
jgi:8-oxo-dGTP diphosphatase